jgi:hypothetical protein
LKTITSDPNQSLVFVAFLGIAARLPALKSRIAGVLTATDPDSENWQSQENKREKIF